MIKSQELASQNDVRKFDYFVGLGLYLKKHRSRTIEHFHKIEPPFEKEDLSTKIMKTILAEE